MADDQTPREPPSIARHRPRRPTGQLVVMATVIVVVMFALVVFSAKPASSNQSPMARPGCEAAKTAATCDAHTRSLAAHDATTLFNATFVIENGTNAGVFSLSYVSTNIENSSSLVALLDAHGHVPTFQVIASAHNLSWFQSPDVRSNGSVYDQLQIVAATTSMLPIGDATSVQVYLPPPTRVVLILVQDGDANATTLMLDASTGTWLQPTTGIVPTYMPLPTSAWIDQVGGHASTTWAVTLRGNSTPVQAGGT